MAQQITPAELDQFGKKLAEFSDKLSDTERTLFRAMLSHDALSDELLGQARGGAKLAPEPLAIKNISPKLNQDFFRLMCW